MSAAEWALAGTIASVFLAALTNLHFRLGALEKSQSERDGAAKALAEAAAAQAAQQQETVTKVLKEILTRRDVTALAQKEPPP